VRLYGGTRTNIGAQRSQLRVSTASAHAVRDLPLLKTPKGAILAPQTTGKPGNVG
jgi:hypothetical protein